MARNPISVDGTVNDFSIHHPNEVREAQKRILQHLLNV